MTRRSFVAAAAAAAPLLLAACATSHRAEPVESRATPLAGAESGVEFDSRALLLMLEDRRLYEPRTLEPMLGGTPALRRALAVTLGRLGDARGRSPLQGLLVDSDVEVRRAAAFALGQLGAADAERSLLVGAVDDDHEVGALAVEGLGKLHAPLADVRKVLGAVEAREAWRRLAPFLFRFKEDAAVDAAVEALGVDDPEVHRGAAYALGRDARPAGLEPLRGLVADPDPFVRAIAARGLGQVGGAEDLERLLPLVGDREISPRVQALRAAAAILGRIDALPPEAWSVALAHAVADPEPGIRAAALAAAGPFLPNPALESALGAAWSQGGTRERELALEAMAVGHLAAAPQLAASAAGSSARMLRAAAAEAAGKLGERDLVARLAGDPEPAVRVAALAALDARQDAPLLVAALADPDPTVRATALDALSDSDALPTPEVAAAIDRARADGVEDDVRRTGIAVLEKRAEHHPARERQPVIEALSRLAGDPDYLVRRAAAAALVELGQPRPAIGAIDTGRDLEAYREILRQTDHPRRVALETERGSIVLELACPEAPLTCLSFLQLAGQGFFDGTLFHRVVPDFVVQGGDPRGDGWGGPGYSLRDEVNRLRYVRGTVGMALSGPDTGGSQFFIALSPQPHLDGGYTAFGRVVEGDAVLDQIRQGDRLIRVREIEAAPGTPVR